MLMRNGKSPAGDQILSPESVQRMLTFQPYKGQYIRQTFGMWHLFENLNVVGHDGGERGYRSLAGFDPLNNNGIIWFATTWPRCECFINEIVLPAYQSWFGQNASVITPGFNSKIEIETVPTPTHTQSKFNLRG